MKGRLTNLWSECERAASGADADALGPTRRSVLDVSYMNANYATKISLAIPFMSALVCSVTAIGAQAGILVCIISALGGFVVGFCMGALSVGLSGLFLTRPDRNESSLVLFGALAGYFLVPPISLGASCVATVLGLRWIL